MNRPVLTGALVLAIVLCLFGAISNAAVIAPQSPLAAETRDEPLIPAERASPQVPIRSALPQHQARHPPAPQPTRIQIAGIDLDADVLPVGVDEAQQFDVPSAGAVGWYKFGSAPGQRGSTVLAAHVDFAGRPGAFFNLASLEPGDKFEIELSDSTSIEYVVVANVLHDKTELPATDLFRRSGDSLLHLITCGGTFNAERRSYQGNVVVTAVTVAA